MSEHHVSPNGSVPSGSVLSALQWRYATKAFDPSRRVPDAVFAELEHSLVQSPSSFGLQPWKFVVVTDAGLKAKLRKLSWDQPQVTDCSHFVVLARKRDVTAADIERFISTTASTRGIPASALDGYKGMMSGFLLQPGFDTSGWTARQVYVALGFLMSAAAMLRVDTCPMEGIDPRGFDEVLGLPEQGYLTTVACAVGYRAADDKYAKAPKVRYPASELVLRK
jgi:nitroreductase